MAEQKATTANIKVKVQPRASRTQIVGYRGDVLHIRVTAPPVAGQANAAVVDLLARALGLAKSRVRIVRGHTSRNKEVVVESLTGQQLQQRLAVRTGKSGTIL